VATDVPGCREVAIAGKTGLLVPVDDATALADAIDTLATSPELRARFGSRARALAEERFSAAAIGSAVVDLYLRLVTKLA
jgi:glycosyltransferase involved in cell wall biosynthesis